MVPFAPYSLFIATYKPLTLTHSSLPRDLFWFPKQAAPLLAKNSLSPYQIVGIAPDSASPAHSLKLWAR